MRLGVDFGTTRIVVATADRGNYPLVGFEVPDGQTREWFPPLVAIRGDERRFGWNAWAVQGNRGWTVLRSLKRLLKRAGLTTRLDIGGSAVPVMELATGLLSAFAQQLRLTSTLSLDPGEPIEAMIGVPANVSAQSPPWRRNASPRATAASRSVNWSHSAASTSGGRLSRPRTTASSRSRSGHCGC